MEDIDLIMFMLPLRWRLHAVGDDEGAGSVSVYSGSGDGCVTKDGAGGYDEEASGRATGGGDVCGDVDAAILVRVSVLASSS